MAADNNTSRPVMKPTPQRCVRDDDVAAEYLCLEASIEIETITARLLKERDRLQSDETDDGADSLYVMRAGLMRIKDLAGVITVVNNDADAPLDDLERTVFGRALPDGGSDGGTAENLPGDPRQS